ncbi:hypothetical protein BA6E_12117 [Bacteroidales bacterium 6E]|nr:hypothetical protein BA6E_12117 [Bacteroidales bacterium 6E]
MKSHLLSKSSTYRFILLGCIGLLLFIILAITLLDVLGKGELVNDEIAESIVFFVCIPGILIGIIGVVITAIRKK